VRQRRAKGLSDLLFTEISHAIRERLVLPNRRFPVQLSAKDIQPFIPRGTFDVSKLLLRVSLFEKLKAKSLEDVRGQLFESLIEGIHRPLLPPSQGDHNQIQ